MNQTEHRVNRSRLSIHQDMNNRLQNRDFTDIDFIKNNKNKSSNRFEIERDEFMQNSNSNDDQNSFLYQRQFSDNIRNNFDRGMPMRPNFEINKNSFDNPNINSNDIVTNMNQLKNKKINNTVSSFDPHSNLADINSDTKLSANINDINICINNINDFGIFFYNNLLNIMNTNFIFSPFLIYSVFGSLFMGCDGNTEVELKNYFNFPRVDVLSSGLTELYQKYLNQTILRGEIKQGNCVIFSDNIDYNPQFCNNINLFTKIRKVSNSNPDKESIDINNIISGITGNAKKSISPPNIANSSVTLLNYANITPTWNCNFSKTSKINNVEYLHAFNQSFGFFEQPNLQVIELESTGNICVGIIYGDIELNIKNYNFIVSNLKRHTLNEIMIPVMNIKTKLRYTNVLKETELQTVFMDLNIPNLFTSQSEITDCIQNIEFNLINKCEYKPIKTSGIVTAKKFIISQAFRFYVRLKSNNCLLFLGSY